MQQSPQESKNTILATHDNVNIVGKFDINKILKKASDMGASDVHITVMAPPIARVNGVLTHIGEEKMTVEDTYGLVSQVLKKEQLKYLQQKGEIDLSYTLSGVGRFRVNAFKQRGSFCMVMRMISFSVPDMESLGLPNVIRELSSTQRGMILVTGPTGSGKSTTLASMIDYMNKNRNAHVVTIEDPIEYLHSHGKCIVNQREVGIDTITFANALRAALREDPDIILVGEMRDLETISTAITAAETGHLVLSTLHTLGAAKTIDRIIDSFPEYQQDQVKVQLSGMLEAVISQQLIPTIDGKSRVVALEIMVATPAIRNLIREGKTHQIQTSIQTGSAHGMITMDKSLVSLYKKRQISLENLMQYCVDEQQVKKDIGR